MRGPAHAKRRKPIGFGDEVATHSHPRLQHLYDISKVLTGFESIERTVPAVVFIVSDTLPLRSATFICVTQGRPRVLTWKAEGTSPDRLRRAERHARDRYAYLAGLGAAAGLTDAETIQAALPPPSSTTSRAEVARGGAFVVLPLVVAGGRVFGALQLDSDVRLDETDLLFVNAVVNQLAVALDRQSAIDERQAVDEARRREAEEKAALGNRMESMQRFLAGASASLSDSLDHRSTLATAAKLAVPFLADICFIDEVGEDGTVSRIAAAFADEPTRERAEALGDVGAAAVDAPAPHRAVLETGNSVFVPELATLASTAGGGAWGALVEAGIGSMMVVPLVARGRTLGSLTFAMAGSGRRYAAVDLDLAHDVAHRAAVSIDNARLHRAVEKAVRDRQDILDIVSHDLRNPLSAIRLGADTLRSSLPTDDTKSRKTLEIVGRSVERMDRMVRDLLDMSSVDAGRLSIQKQPHLLRGIVGDALELHQSMASLKSQELTADLPTGELEVLCDRERILQVLANLLGNAIKFTPRGGGIALRVREQGSDARIEISDSGPGIPADEVPRVFERYWGAPQTAWKGTGLGMYISRGVVLAHGGSIWVESAVGHGATFLFTLPLVGRPTSDSVEPRGPRRRSAKTRGRGSVEAAGRPVSGPRPARRR